MVTALSTGKWYKREAPVETGAVLPKLTAYEKI
jgi:hypothetical protein